MTFYILSYLPGYDDAQWSFDDTLPEVEALYAKEV